MKTTTFEKSPTGINGLDEITFGGLPKGRPTLVCGGAGSGKTLFGIEFIVKGATEFNEPGVIISFEESAEEIIKNVASLGFNIDQLIEKKLVGIDYIYIERSEIEETGEFDLEGLFIRLDYLINSIGAKRVLLDTIEALFAGISNHAILRAELRRLFRWLKNKGVTAVVTGEKGNNTFTRHGLEEYISDCVILLDNRVNEQYSTRRLRIVKYRGSFHGVDEYPFLITENGISVLPISSLKLVYNSPKKFISSGISGVDEMLDRKGFYKGSTILISGTAGTGKTSLLTHFVEAVCRKGEKALFVALEESESQIIRNTQSIGINLKKYRDEGLLKFHVTRPTYYSLEMHLVLLHNLIKEFKPDVVAVDPISNLTTISTERETNSILTRLIDFLKVNGITAAMSSLTSGGNDYEKTDVGVSSLVDTWILLRDIESNGERNRAISILKSRGMAHSNQVRKLLVTRKGVEVLDVFVYNKVIPVEYNPEKLNKDHNHFQSKKMVLLNQKKSKTIKKKQGGK